MLGFQAALINTKFDKDSRNVLRFDSREAQEDYFDVASLFLQANNINFNAGSLLETTIIYQVKENESINGLLSKNYCIIKDNNENADLKYYYYFIRNSMQDSSNQIKCWLELDIFQTYYIDMQFSDCEILRAHLNRFIDNGDGTVSFDGRTESNLFEREQIQSVSKRLTKRTKCSLYDNVPNITPEAKKWLDDNVICWMYLYLDSSHGYKTTSENVRFLETNILGKESGKIETKLTAACVPILRNGKIFKCHIKAQPNFDDIVNIGVYSINKFMENNNGASYVYAIKLSSIHPFYTDRFSKWEISGTESEILTLAGSWSSEQSITGLSLGRDFSQGNMHCKEVTTDKGSGLLYVEKQPSEIIAKYDSSIQYKFSKSEILNSNKDPKFNPKLLSSDYKSINIGNEIGNFEYDAQKINDKSINILISEPLSPDITKSYIRYEGKESGVYIKETSENFTGNINSNDTSLVLVTTQYQQMLANNKNFFLQNAVNRTKDFANGLLGTGLNIASGNMGAAVSSGAGTIGNLISSHINEGLTVDNMKNAPANIENAKGNVLLNLMSSNIGVFVEEYDILPNEKEIINDYMCKYGFTYNKLGNIKEFDNLRKNYNYIEAEIEETSGINISNAVHDKFKNLFRRGVRFWNYVKGSNVDFNYKKENYEKWLEG